MSALFDDAGRSALSSEVSKLKDEFRGVFAPETIERFIDESADRLSGARLNDFVPLLVYRFSRERLTALAQSEAKLTKEAPEVLFVCIHNSGRSQMAAGLLAKVAAGHVHVRTAGSDPADEINPFVLQAMEEVGVDLSAEFPKPLTDEFVAAADVVVTMGCGDACPIYPGKRYEDWDLEDPDGKSLAEVRLIRDDLEFRVANLLGELIRETG